MSEWIEERISEDKHFRIIGDFICGADDPLNIFLSDNAIDYDDDGLGNTYVFLYNGEIIAYYTIKANGIQVYNEEKEEYEAVPVIEIARIAVSYDIQGKGFGKRIFYDYILPKVKAVADLIGVQAIMVFVEHHNKKGVHFYKTIGFEKADDSVQRIINETFNEQCDLYLVKLKDIKEKSFPAVGR